MYVDLGDDGDDCIHSGLGPAVENTVNTVDLDLPVITTLLVLTLLHVLSIYGTVRVKK